MKYTKQIRFICLLMLCAMLTGILQPAMADVKAERILKRMENLIQIPGTHLLIAQESKQYKWGIYDTDANLIIPLEYEKISYLAYDCLTVASLPEPAEPYGDNKPIPLEEINSKALMTFDGTVHTEYAYGVFKAFSPRWIAAWVLEEGTLSDNDFTPDKKHYFRIARCDVFYRDPDAASESGEAAFHQVLSLTRDEFKDAAAHGDYLSVQNRNNEVTMYNKTAGAVEGTFKSVKDSVYAIKNWMIINRETGEMIMDGCSAVSEIQTEDELLLLATRIDFQGNKQKSLITTKGEVVLPLWNVEISSVSMDYAIVTSNANGKKGLYSCREKRMLLPCAYDEIFENKNAIDRFNCHGYICAKKDDQFFCYEVATRKLLTLPELDPDVKIDRYGATFFATQKNGKLTKTMLISPDGNVKSMNCSFKKTRGSGYLMVASFSLGGSVVNWYGNNYLPQYYSNITITDDDHFIIKTKKSGYELYRIPE